MQLDHRSPRPTGRSPHALSRDPRHVVGRLGEDIAAAHLACLGFAILARNARTRHGEIDLIAFDGRTLVVVEVKTRRASARAARRGGSPGAGPLEGLRPRQRARLRRLTAAWLAEHRRTRPLAEEIRFDAVGVLVDANGRLLRLDHVEAAW
jgi:putative endonuclease